MASHRTLADLLRQPGLLIVPGVYDLVSARLALGLSVAIHPVMGLLAAASAMEGAYKGLRANQAAPSSHPLFDFDRLTRLLGSEGVGA